METGSSSDATAWASAQYASPAEVGRDGSQHAGAGAAEAAMWGAYERRGRSCGKQPQPAARCVELHPEVQLCPTQVEVLNRVVSGIDTASTSVVITNPRQQDNPIVFVTKPWENMCGFTYEQAVGQNPRLTQGAHSDESVVKLMSGALRSQRSCKVMVLNYHAGRPDRPFWNMLSISPIVHNRQLMFYLASLQDYTYHMHKLVRLTPTQFCRSAEHHQMTRRVPSSFEPHDLARPAIFEADDECAITLQPQGTSDSLASSVPLKRLGWSKLTLEPEHLADRVVDALQSLEARYERVDSTAQNDDVFVVNAEIDDVACRVLITRDPANIGAYRIACTRMGGDTFAYHNAFRQLRHLLGDAVHNYPPLPSAGKRPVFGGGDSGCGGSGGGEGVGGIGGGSLLLRGVKSSALGGGGSALGIRGGSMGLAPLPDVADCESGTSAEATGGAAASDDA